jgi:thioredoxin 1
MSKAEAVTTSNFEQEVLKSSTPVLVDFWAEWCGPCKIIAPHLDKIAEDYGDQIKIRKVDIEEERGLAEKYRVESIPTLMFFKEGKLVDQLIGARPPKEITSRLDSLLKASS